MDDATYQDITNLIIQYGIFCEKDDLYKEELFSLIKNKLLKICHDIEVIINRIREYGNLCKKHSNTSDYQEFIKQEEVFKSICNMLNKTGN